VTAEEGATGDVGDDAVACSGARAEDGRLRQHSGVRGDRRASA
jgi:hypothetical protein